MARSPYPSDKQDQYMVRLPEGMRDLIKAAAEANGRSMNAEIVAALDEKFPTLGGMEKEVQGILHAVMRVNGMEPGPAKTFAQKAVYDVVKAAETRLNSMLNPED